MSDTPASPAASRLARPGWLDGRLVLGVLLVLVSVVVGARVLSAADRSTLVWAAERDLTAGSQLTGDDLALVRVRLFDGVDAGYIPQSQDPAGQVVSRGLQAGELLPRSALVTAEDVDFRLVTVPVDAARFPPGLDGRGQVDVWLTPESALERAEQAAEGAPTTTTTTPTAPTDPAGAPTGGILQLTGAQPVLLRVTVDRVQGAGETFGGGSTTVPVVLRVRPDDVARLVSAMSLGRIDLVLVPRGAERQSVLDAGPG